MVAGSQKAGRSLDSIVDLMDPIRRVEAQHHGSISSLVAIGEPMARLADGFRFFNKFLFFHNGNSDKPVLVTI